MEKTDSKKGYTEYFHGTIEWVQSSMLAVSFASFIFIESVSTVQHEKMKVIASLLLIFSIPFHIFGLVCCRDVKLSDNDKSSTYLDTYGLLGAFISTSGFIAMLMALNDLYAFSFLIALGVVGILGEIERRKRKSH